ncbi:metalloproteinase inhibitor 2-like [Ptychodera flava]|uniref:metalloproteinase inhibitor 2-like n=1 Tax=Ptychodera flava TaxID=63121 RepID=UPI00396A69AC
MAKAGTMIFITILYICLAVKSVYGCSCMPSHPQDHFCRADFVVRAKVIDHRFIYEMEEPEEPTTELPDIVPTDLPAVLPSSDESEDSIDDIFEKEDDSKDSLEDKLEKDDEEEKEEDNIISNEIIFGRFKKSIMPLPPLSEVEDEILEEGPREPLAQAWKVRITKVYKGQELVIRDDRVELFTAPYEGLCGVSLDKSVHYVLSGTYYDGKLRINSCGLSMNYDKLTSRLRQGLGHGYSTACSECRIAPCFGLCRETVDTCSWKPFGQLPDCEGLYSRCVRRKSGECGWHKNKNYKSCDAIRRGE